MDIHLEQIKVEDQEYKEDVQWLPIEAIKANLYSKESDVYAFGMITWEVMTAFGQEGFIYDDDEEIESLCIPFNYQKSENILPHLVEGYIPEKPLKCPEWFYQEITRPCLLHQKIDRPSMKTILNILQASLHKNLPRQIFQRTQGKPDDYKDSDSDYTSREPWLGVYDECFDDSDPQSQQRPVSCYENWYIDPSYTEEFQAQ
ncbi:insulin-like growth factor 1 receptor [Crassostrea virginica]